jgi:tripartite-type tricarboxylate transporter receptor subunit TctC
LRPSRTESSPQEMADHIRKEAAKWAEVIRTANIQLD